MELLERHKSWISLLACRQIPPRELHVPKCCAKTWIHTFLCTLTTFPSGQKQHNWMERSSSTACHRLSLANKQSGVPHEWAVFWQKKGGILIHTSLPALQRGFGWRLWNTMQNLGRWWLYSSLGSKGSYHTFTNIKGSYLAAKLYFYVQTALFVACFKISSVSYLALLDHLGKQALELTATLLSLSINESMGVLHWPSKYRGFKLNYNIADNQQTRD